MNELKFGDEIRGGTFITWTDDRRYAIVSDRLPSPLFKLPAGAWKSDGRIVMIRSDAKRLKKVTL